MNQSEADYRAAKAWAVCLMMVAISIVAGIVISLNWDSPATAEIVKSETHRIEIQKNHEREIYQTNIKNIKDLINQGYNPLVARCAITGSLGSTEPDYCYLFVNTPPKQHNATKIEDN